MDDDEIEAWWRERENEGTPREKIASRSIRIVCATCGQHPCTCSREVCEECGPSFDDQ